MSAVVLLLDEECLEKALEGSMEIDYHLTIRIERREMMKGG
jgi:hypothetical protein